MSMSLAPTLDAGAPVRGRLALTGGVALAEAGHLAWEWTHGGIVSHHLLADPTLPALWNGWGLLVVPALAWVASARLVRPEGHRWRLHAPAVRRLLGALLGGLALSVAFATGRADMASGIFAAIGLSSLVLRVYRSEYLLGFVLGMACTFGGLLPTVIGGAIALLSAGVWFGPWRLARAALQRARS